MSSFRTLVLVALCAPLFALAADLPPDLEPLPEPPPPPAGFDSGVDEAPVVINSYKQGEDLIEEYSVNGQAYMMKVTPPNGVSFYLSKESRDGGWAPMDGPVGRLAVPQWVLFRF